MFILVHNSCHWYDRRTSFGLAQFEIVMYESIDKFTQFDYTQDAQSDPSRYIRINNGFKRERFLLTGLFVRQLQQKYRLMSIWLLGYIRSYTYYHMSLAVLNNFGLDSNQSVAQGR
jgi:hypothetical protein